VTGGAGYVGSHCMIELLNAGFTVMPSSNVVFYFNNFWRIYLIFLQVVAIDNFVNAVIDPTGSSDYPESILR
jgi:UDP-glucose 4-epimerase